MKLSIIIPTYETAALTAEACRAVLSTMPSGSELIVVDDASTDGTAELLSATFPALTLIRMPVNSRFAAAANRGVDASSGDLVLLLNSDAFVQSGTFGALLEAFAREPRLGIAGARLLNEDGTPQWSGGRTPTLLWLTVMAGGFARLRPARRRKSAVPSTTDWVSGAAMAFRREVWNAAGPLREHYRFYAQDLDFCMRARAAGWNVQIVERAMVVHGQGQTVRQWREVAELHHDPAMMWLDLLTWAREFHGARWAATARALMSGAVVLRLIVRWLRTLTLRGNARANARSTTLAYARALRQLLVERE
jgi:GT2 family glycosyltransferase